MVSHALVVKLVRLRQDEICLSIVCLGHMSYHSRCTLCNVLIRSERSYRLKNCFGLFQRISYLYELLHSSRITDEAIICENCRKKHERILLGNNRMIFSEVFGSTESMDIDGKPVLFSQGTQTVDSTVVDVAVQCSIASLEKILLPVRMTNSSHKYCTICHAKFDSKSSMIIPEDVRLKILIKYTIYLPSGVRCCSKHFANNTLALVAIDMIKKSYPDSTFFTTENVTNLLYDLKNSNYNYDEKKPSISFDNPFNYSDQDYYVLTGIDKSNFEFLCRQVQMRNTNNRSISTAIGCLLMKLRLGLSDQILTTLCAFDDRRIVSSIVESARIALMQHFVPFHVGFKHINRQYIIEKHTRPLAKHLLTDGKDVAILIFDSTYIYVQKSTSNLLQRKLFSLHKKRPLIKPMIVVATDGYIVSVIGPYYSDWKNNDANITNHLLRTNQQEILNWLQAGDTFVVDRGFRDIIGFVQSLGYQIFMPSFLSKSKKKFSVCYLKHTFDYLIIRLYFVHLDR